MKCNYILIDHCLQQVSIICIAMLLLTLLCACFMQVWPELQSAWVYLVF